MLLFAKHHYLQILRNALLIAHCCPQLIKGKAHAFFCGGGYSDPIEGLIGVLMCGLSTGCSSSS